MSGRGYGHESAAAISTTWLTPLHIVTALGRFDVDPCAYPGWVTADRLICRPDDGLTADWDGRIWLNPPYGREVWRWLDRLSSHGHGTALIFARTETAGFFAQVWGKADALLFLRGRIRFHRPDGTPATTGAGAPSVLVAYGQRDADALKAADIPGHFVPLRQEVGS